MEKNVLNGKRIGGEERNVDCKAFKDE